MSLKNMLYRLFEKEGVADITFEQMYEAFNVIGREYPMTDGKIITPIEINEKELLLKIYMPKGSLYPENKHSNADEKLVVITGMIRSSLSRLTRGVLGHLNWSAGTIHDLTALEDTLAYCKITKVKNIR